MKASEVENGKTYWLEDRSYTGPVVVEIDTHSDDYFYTTPLGWATDGIWPVKKLLAKYSAAGAEFKEYIQAEAELESAQKALEEAKDALEKAKQLVCERLKEQLA